jgi:hypothetical protein
VTYKLTITQKPGYLHALVTGQNARDTVSAYIREVIGECMRRGCLRVLVEERLEGARLGTLDVFEMVSGGAPRYLRTVKAMAYVDVYAEGETMRFAENVAANRAFPIKLFATVAAAEEWLLDEVRHAGPAADADTHLP